MRDRGGDLTGSGGAGRQTAADRAAAGGAGDRAPGFGCEADHGTVGVTSSAQARQRLLTGVTCPSASVRAVAETAAGLVDDGGFEQLGAAGQLADDVTVLARVTQLLAAETARRVRVADVHDVTVTGVRSTLTRAGWSGRAAWLSLKAGRFADNYPRLLDLWRAGEVNAETIAAVATGVRSLPQADADTVVDWITPLLSSLDDKQVTVAVTAAVDRLRPEDGDARRKRAYDDRYLTSSRFRDQVLIEARLPALEGEAFLATVAAYAEKLRSEDDGLTKGQRQADALAAMVAALAADGKTPSHHGQPAATTVLIPLSEAERVAAGHPRTPQPLPNLTDLTGSEPDPWTSSGHDHCGRRPFSCLPMTPGVIGQHHTLGDAAARFLLCASELTGAIVTTGGDVHPHPGQTVAALLGAAPLQPLALGRGQRFATPAQRQALEIRDRGCVIPNCSIEPRQCQAHHEPGWTDAGRTDLDALALLCWPHHRQVDHGRWTLTRNPDPNGPHWHVQPQPRHRWRT